MRAPESHFERYMPKQILFFAYLMYSSVSGAKALKKMCPRSAISNFSEKFQNIFEIGLKKYGVFVQKSFIVKIFRKKTFADIFFVVYVLIYPLSKFGGNRTNSLWVLAFYSVRFKWKKLIRENNAKYVNQTGNFYFRPKLKTSISLPIFYIFENFFRWKFMFRPVHKPKIKISTKWSV